jgi:hypothetical protein
MSHVHPGTVTSGVELKANDAAVPGADPKGHTGVRERERDFFFFFFFLKQNLFYNLLHLRSILRFFPNPPRAYYYQHISHPLSLS